MWETALAGRARTYRTQNPVWLAACLGLVGLAASATERRTAEIGVRKAMGAGTAEVMRMLVWLSTKPVLWANLIAWPLAAWVMHRRLGRFAYHVELDPLWFAAASGIALAWRSLQ